MGVSENMGTPKSSIFNKVFHYFHHPFWGIPILGNPHMVQYIIYHFSLCITLRSGGARTDRWRVWILSFFWTILEVHFIGIKLYQNHGFPMILGRICHNGLQHFMVNFSRKSPSRQANRCWFCQWGFFLGIHKFRCLTFNYDDNCGLGHDLRFPGKKWRGKKKIMAKIFQKVPSYGVSWLFSQQFFKIQVLDLHAIGMRLSCSTIGPAGRGIWWDKKSLKGIDWGR